MEGRCLAGRDDEEAVGGEGERALREGERRLAGLPLTVHHQTHLVLQTPICHSLILLLNSLPWIVCHSWQHT